MNEENIDARIVVTGGCGFIGSHLVYRLAEIGFDVTVVDDMRQGDYVFDLPNVRYIFEDVAWCDLTERMPRPLAIIHLANSPRVRRSLEEPRDTIDNNITTTTAVCDWQDTGRHSCSLRHLLAHSIKNRLILTHGAKQRVKVF